MSTIYRNEQKVNPYRYQSRQPEIKIRIGGQSYHESELESTDWDSLNQVSVNKIDNNECR